jgi:hypothetical protein
MSEHKSIQLSLSSSKGNVSSSSWVKLEQVKPSETRKYAALENVFKAWMYSASGKSAKMYRQPGCPVEFDTTNGKQLVRFFMGFYAWPSSKTLPYTVISNIGELGPRQTVYDIREFTLFANNSKGVILPYYMESVFVAWESLIYNRRGEQIAPPTITNNHTNLIFSEECFGVLRVSGIAFGSYHVLTIELDKKNDTLPSKLPEVIKGNTYYLDPIQQDNANRYENLAPTIQVYWPGGDENSPIDQSSANTTATSSLNLEVPECVQAALSACPGSDYITYWCTTTSKKLVYYSTCDGSVLDVRDGKNPTSFCSKAEQTGPSAGGWLRGGI